MDAASPPSSAIPVVDLREYLVILRRRWFTLILVTAMVVAATILYSVRQTPQYRSTAQVLVEAVDLSPAQQGGSDAPNMETEQRLLRSTSVARLALERLGDGSSVDEVTRRLSVDVPPETEILVVAYTDPDSERARDAAAAFAEAYLDFRRQRVTDALEAAAEPLQEQIAALDARLQALNQQIAQADDPAELAPLQTEANALVGQTALLQQRLSDLTTPENLQVGDIVDPATLPASPSSPQTTRNALLGLVIGLLLGAGIAVVRERLDDRLRGTGDLEAFGGATVLAAIPRLGSRARSKTVLYAESAPESGTWEAYRTLRAGLLFAAERSGMKTILVTSAHPSEGKSTVTANLGVALAQAGRRVVVVSSDLRQPTLHRFFQGSSSPGMTDVILLETSLAQAIQVTHVPNVELLASGHPAIRPTELLHSEQMSQMIAELEAMADCVLLDSAPVLLAADALVLAPHVDGVLLVADAAKTSRHAIAQARERLERVGASFVGSILNNERFSEDGYAVYGRERRGSRGRSFRLRPRTSLPRRARDPEQSVG